MSEELTATVDAWAEAHQIARSDAICRLVEFGLTAAPADPKPHPLAADPVSLEEFAVRQLDHLLDPSLSLEERERRIRRLTEGPPEFSHERLDLPNHKS